MYSIAVFVHSSFHDFVFNVCIIDSMTDSESLIISQQAFLHHVKVLLQAQDICVNVASKREQQEEDPERRHHE